MPKILHPERMPRSHRKEQIKRFIRKTAERYGECASVSALDISEHLEIGKSTHLSKLLWEMVDSGEIKAYPTRWINGWEMWVYTNAACEMEQAELALDFEG